MANNFFIARSHNARIVVPKHKVVTTRVLAKIVDVMMKTFVTVTGISVNENGVAAGMACHKVARYFQRRIVVVNRKKHLHIGAIACHFKH